MRSTPAGERSLFMITWRRLLAVEELERSRRGSILRTWPPALVGGLVGAAALYGLAASVDAGEARAWWLVATIALAGLVVLRGPWRMFWRPDAPLLGRLPIAGRALYGAAAVRSLRAAALSALAIAPAAVAVTLPDAAAGGRALGLAALLRALAAALAPALTTVAGALVASPKARRQVAQLAGEVSAPPTTWLSILPVLGVVAIAAVGFVLAPIVRGETATAAGHAGLVVGAALAGGAAAFLAGGWLADGSLAAATREVSALDAVRLAHVELDRPRRVEGALGRALAPGPVYAKDVSLMRRRYPAPFIVTGILMIAMGIGGVAGGAGWLVVPATAIAAYAVVLGRRLTIAPVERPRLLATLPLADAAVTRSKRLYAAWRALWPPLLGLAPAAVSGRASAGTIAIVVGITLAGVVMAALAAAPQTLRASSV